MVAKVSSHILSLLQRYGDQPGEVIITTRGIPQTEHHEILASLGCVCLGELNAPALGIFGHVVQCDQISVVSELALTSWAVEIHKNNIFTIPKPPFSKTTVTPEVLVDSTIAAIGFPNGPWADPDFDGGAGKGIRVIEGHCDTGINESHGGEMPFLDGPTPYPNPPTPLPPSRIIGRYDPWPGNAFHPHGTWTAEIVGRSIAKSSGNFKGCCYRAYIFDARALNSAGQGTTTNVVAAINACVSKEVDVINLSLGGAHDDLTNMAVEAAWRAGIVVVCASGNSGTPGTPPTPCDRTVGSPADSDNAISCLGSDTGSPDPTDPTKEHVQGWSSRGPRWNGTTLPFAITAPGLTIQPGTNDPTSSGTSFSAPHVTGVALALIHKLLRTAPNMTKQQRAALVRDTLMRTAKPLGYKAKYGVPAGYCIEGNGRVQADVAYAKIGGSTPPQGKGAPSRSEHTAVMWHPKTVPPTTEPTLLTAIPDSTDYTSGDIETVTGELTLENNGIPLAGRTIVVHAGPLTGTIQTDANGKYAAEFPVPNVTVPTPADTWAEFQGDL